MASATSRNGYPQRLRLHVHNRDPSLAFGQAYRLSSAREGQTDTNLPGFLDWRTMIGIAHASLNGCLFLGSAEWTANG
jgi:hypothetical protein